MPSLSQVEGWHAPAGRRTCETLASDPGQADQTGSAGGCQKNWDPAGRSFRKTTRAASAESEVRPGPRLPTLRAHHVKIREAAPVALSTLSLPNRRGCLGAAVLDHNMPNIRYVPGIFSARCDRLRAKRMLRREP